MSPIEICNGPKAPARAVVEVPASAVIEEGNEVEVVLPDGKRVLLYSTQEGFEPEEKINGKEKFQNGEWILLKNGLVARAVKGEKEEGSPIKLTVTEYHLPYPKITR